MTEWKYGQAVVQLSVVTSMEMSDLSFGKGFFEALFSADARLTPEMIGHVEDLFPYRDTTSLEPYWGKRWLIEGPGVKSHMLRNVSWTNDSALKSYGDIDLTDVNGRGGIIHGSISLIAVYDPATDWLTLFKKTCDLTKASAALLHVPAAVETRKSEPGYSSYYPGVRGSILKKQLPNLAWATFFGPPYANEIDVAVMTSLGCHIEPLAGGYLVLLSDNILDCFNDFSAFSDRRVALKKHFRPDLFRITEEAPIT